MDMVVGTSPHVQMDGVADVVRAPTDLPPPLAQRGPENIRIDMKTIEVTGQLDDGTTYHYWTFDGKVPGPFVRVRVGDTVEVHLKNADDSALMHNVDFHAVTGPGGGGVATQAAPGEEQGLHLQGAQSRSLRLPLRDADRWRSTSPTACMA